MADKCPNCGHYALEDKYGASIGGGGFGNTQECSNCGYER